MPGAPQEVLDKLAAVDSASQLDDVLALPDHVRDALWRVESAALPRTETEALIVCGMGGSAIGGDLANAAIGDRLCRPMATVRGYELPSWATPEMTVLCSSYSGSTEETIACYDAAEALGANRITATTGGRIAESARSDGVPVIGLPAGLQPRAAVGYMFTVVAEVAETVGVAPAIRTEIDIAAAHLAAARDEIAEQAASLAKQLEGTVPVIYGSDLTKPIAYRWKCQFNENAKIPAFEHELPEMDHNEIVGWESAAEAGRFAAIFLGDCDQHPREHQRFELTAELIRPGAAEVITIDTRGETRTERLLRAVFLGDLTSIFLAGLRGADPAPVAVIESLKDRLGRPEAS